MIARTRRTLDVLHGHVVLPVDLAQLVDLHDVSVHEVGGELRFVDEELEPGLLLRVVRMDDLERDALREARGAELLGLVHRGHAALRDLSHETKRARVFQNVVFGVHTCCAHVALCLVRSCWFSPLAHFMTLDIRDITIIGAGPTGLFAAFYAGMRGVSARIVDALPEFGGQLTALYPEKYIFDVAGLPKILAKDLVTDLVTQMRQFHAG